MNRKSYQKIPQELEGKVIFVTGTLPGVGKSFVKNEWCRVLREANYRVFNCGTTQKASEDATVASNSRLKYSENFLANKIHTQTNGFYFVDEAFMWTQERTDNLIASYPHMCFILFGDPLQFDPVEKGNPLARCDFGFNLTKQYRAKDQDLLDAIINLKKGKLPIAFLYQRAVNKINGDELRICYKNSTKDDYNSVTNKHEIGYIYRSSITPKGSFHFTEQYHYRDLPWRNGQLWKIIKVQDNINFDLISLDGKKIIPVSEYDLEQYFTLHMAINNHKIQGDTISECDIWIDIENLKGNLLFKHLYVAISRAQKSSQIKFLKSQIDTLLSSNGACLTSSWYETGLDYSNIEDTDSAKLSLFKAKDLIEYFMKSFPKVSQTLRYISANFNTKVSSTVVEDEVLKSKSIQFNKAQTLEDLIKQIEKSRRYSIQKYLTEHYGIGYSEKWNDIEKNYADCIRANYTKVELFLRGAKIKGKELKVSDLTEDEKQEVFTRKCMEKYNEKD